MSIARAKDEGRRAASARLRPSQIPARVHVPQQWSVQGEAEAGAAPTFR